MAQGTLRRGSWKGRNEMVLKKNKEEDAPYRGMEEGSFVGFLRSTFNAKINGLLVSTTVTAVLALVVVILVSVMWNRLDDDIQTQEDVLWACSGSNTEPEKTKTIPSSKSSDNPTDFKTRFNLLQSDPDERWSRSGSYYLVPSTSRYRMRAHVTVRFKSTKDFVLVGVFGEYVGSGASANASENVYSYVTQTVTPMRIDALNGNVTDLLEEVRSVDAEFFSTVKSDTKLFVSVTQKPDSSAEIYGVKDCGSNFFSIVEYAS